MSFAFRSLDAFIGRRVGKTEFAVCRASRTKRAERLRGPFAQWMLTPPGVSRPVGATKVRPRTSHRYLATRASRLEKYMNAYVLGSVVDFGSDIMRIEIPESSVPNGMWLQLDGNYIWLVSRICG